MKIFFNFSNAFLRSSTYSRGHASTSPTFLSSAHFPISNSRSPQHVRSEFCGDINIGNRAEKLGWSWRNCAEMVFGIILSRVRLPHEYFLGFDGMRRCALGSSFPLSFPLVSSSCLVGFVGELGADLQPLVRHLFFTPV